MWDVNHHHSLRDTCDPNPNPHHAVLHCAPFAVMKWGVWHLSACDAATRVYLALYMDSSFSLFPRPLTAVRFFHQSAPTLPRWSAVCNSSTTMGANVTEIALERSRWGSNPFSDFVSAGRNAMGTWQIGGASTSGQVHTTRFDCAGRYQGWWVLGSWNNSMYVLTLGFSFAIAL